MTVHVYVHMPADTYGSQESQIAWNWSYWPSESPSMGERWEQSSGHLKDKQAFLTAELPLQPQGMPFLMKHPSQLLHL